MKKAPLADAWASANSGLAAPGSQHVSPMSSDALRPRSLAGFALASTCLAVLAWASAANAQTEPATDLGEVVVTAQKRDERAVDVPIAIAHASGEQLLASGVTSYSQLQQIMPGVIISNTGAYAQPAVRGVTTQSVGIGAEVNVATYVDGVYQPFIQSLFMDTEGVAAIDVLKGPQGTLFGRNATGGAVLLTNYEPTPTPQGQVSAQYSSFSNRMLYGRYSGPITDKISFMVNGYARKSDNYIKDIGNFDPARIDNSRYGGKLLFEPTDKLSLQLSYDRREMNDPTSLTYQYVGFVKALVDFPGALNSRSRSVTSLNQPNKIKDTLASYGVKVKWDTPIGVFTEVASRQNHANYELFDYDGTPALDQQSYIQSSGRVLQNEINLTSHSGKMFDYVLGLFYYNFRDHTEYYRIQVISPTVLTVFPLGTPLVNVKSWAGYADVTANLGDWHLTGGLRYSTDDVEQTDTRRGVSKTTFNSLIPRAVVRYSLGPNTNVYASYSQGYKAGGFNPYTVPAIPVKPEKLRAYELGYKTSHRRWALNSAGYYYDYSDLQVSALQYVNGVGAVVTKNAAKARIYGAEVSFQAEPIDRLHVNLAGAYTHARYLDYTTFNPVLPVVSPSTVPGAIVGRQTASCATGGVFCVSDLSGQRFVRAPEWSFSAGVDYTWIMPVGRLTANANVSWQSRYAPTSPDWALSNVVSNGIQQPGTSGQRFANSAYGIVNVKLQWAVNDHVKLSVFSNNLTDTKYYTAYAGNTQGVLKRWGPSREYGARVDYRF